LSEHRSASIVDAQFTTADGYAERATAVEMLARLPKTRRRRTVAGDKGDDTDRVRRRRAGARVHAAHRAAHQQATIRDRRRTTRHPGHALSMRKRKRIAEPFGWVKTIGGGRKLRYRGRERNRAWFTITTAVDNVIRIVALDDLNAA
jgi:hypothetical protein